jgi:hypothetical protein
MTLGRPMGYHGQTRQQEDPPMGYTPEGSGEKSWLQRMAEKIPGIAGYQAKETRRDVDKLYRESLADRLRRVKDPVAAAVRDLTDGGRLLEITPLERISKKVDTVENRIRFASYGYTGFFDAVQIKEQQLDAIYQFDLRLVEKVEAIEAQAAALGGASGTPADLKAAASALEHAVDDLGTTFDTRQQSIGSFGEASAPGRPLFT